MVKVSQVRSRSRRALLCKRAADGAVPTVAGGSVTAKAPIEWDDPRRLFMSPHMKVMTSKGGREAVNRARSFQSNVVPEILRRNGGSSHEINAALDTADFPVQFVSRDKMPNGAGGVYNGPGYPVRISASTSPDRVAGVVGHELRHAYDDMVPRQYVGKDDSALNEVYGFRGVDINTDDPGYSAKYGDRELPTTNRQHQLLQYNRLWDRLGREPTPDEYLKHISEMPNDDLLESRNRRVNVYQAHADDAADDAAYGDYARRVLTTVPNTVPRRYTPAKGAEVPPWVSQMPTQAARDSIIQSIRNANGRTTLFPRDIDYSEQHKQYKQYLQRLKQNRLMLYRRALMRTAQTGRNGQVLPGGGIPHPTYMTA